MTIKNFTVLISIIFISGCISIPNTASLLSQSTHQSISLIEALENDELFELADKIADAEESLAEACENTNDITMQHLEDKSSGFNTLFKYLFGELELSECQIAARKMKALIDEIIIQHPKYAKFRILIPDIKHYDIGGDNGN